MRLCMRRCHLGQARGRMPKTRLSFLSKELCTSSAHCLIPWVLKWNLACLNTWLYIKKINWWTRRNGTMGFFASFTNSEYFGYTMAAKDDSGAPGNSEERNINHHFVMRRARQSLKLPPRTCDCRCLLRTHCVEIAGVFQNWLTLEEEMRLANSWTSKARV